MSRRITTSDLSLEEQVHVRNALLLMRTKVGGWRSLSKLLRFDETTVIKSGNGSRTITASMAFRLARALGVTVDDLLRGRVTDLATCPRCGYEDSRTKVVSPPAVGPKPRVRPRRVDVSPMWIRP